MTQIKNETLEYKGYTLSLSFNHSHTCLIYRNGGLVKCIAGNILPDGSNNRVEKAKQYIDSIK
jgi:hypothetical protein